VGVRDERCLNCGRRNPGLWGFHGVFRALGQDFGFMPFALGVCLVLYAIALLLQPEGIASRGVLGLLSPGIEANYLLGASGAIPVFEFGRWWTPLSATWLHGGLLHIGFNLYWIYQLSPAVSHLYGPARSVLIYIGSSVVGFTATSLAGAYGGFLPSFLRGAPVTVGASAAIFGWLGALVYYGRRSGSTRMSQQMLGFVIPLMVLGLLLPMVDNWAHAGGFAGGYLLGRVLDPLRPERVDHAIAAVAALIASAAAIVVSFLAGLPTG
jgi:rhomboid protease GluP